MREISFYGLMRTNVPTFPTQTKRVPRYIYEYKWKASSKVNHQPNINIKKASILSIKSTVLNPYTMLCECAIRKFLQTRRRLRPLFSTRLLYVALSLRPFCNKISFFTLTFCNPFGLRIIIHCALAILMKINIPTKGW